MTDSIGATTSRESEYLSQSQQSDALQYLSDAWALPQMTNSLREAWLDVLCQLRVGELKPALALAGKSAHDRRFRPDPYPTMDAVMELRHQAVPIEQRVASKTIDPDTGDVTVDAENVRQLAKHHHEPSDEERDRVKQVIDAAMAKVRPSTVSQSVNN